MAIFILYILLIKMVNPMNMNQCPRQGDLLTCTWQGVDDYRYAHTPNGPTRIVFNRLEKGAKVFILDTNIREIVIKAGTIECKDIHHAQQINIIGCVASLQIPTTQVQSTNNIPPQEFNHITWLVTMTQNKIGVPTAPADVLTPQEIPIYQQMIMWLIMLSVIIGCTFLIIIIKKIIKFKKERSRTLPKLVSYKKGQTNTSFNDQDPENILFPSNLPEPIPLPEYYQHSFVQPYSSYGYCACNIYKDPALNFAGPIYCFIANITTQNPAMFEPAGGELIPSGILDLIDVILAEYAPGIFEFLCTESLLNTLGTCIDTATPVAIDELITTFVSMDSLLNSLKTQVCANRAQLLSEVANNLDCFIDNLMTFTFCGSFVPLNAFETAFSNFTFDPSQFGSLATALCPTVLEMTECGVIQLEICSTFLATTINTVMMDALSTTCKTATSPEIINTFTASTALYCSLRPSADLITPITQMGDNVAEIVTLAHDKICTSHISSILECIVNRVPTSTSKMDKMLSSVVAVSQLTAKGAVEQVLCSSQMKTELAQAMITCNQTNMTEFDSCIATEMPFWMALAPYGTIEGVPDNTADMKTLLCPRVDNMINCALEMFPMCSQYVADEAGNLSIWLRHEDCNGDWAASTLNDIIDADLSALNKPTVTVALGDKSVSEGGLNYISKDIQFTCDFTIGQSVQNSLTYDITWLVDNQVAATHAGVSYGDRLSKKWTESDWRATHAMPFTVSCKYQAKQGGNNYGPEKNSEGFFAGMKVSKTALAISEGGYDSFNVEITVPTGYRYLAGATSSEQETARVNNQLTIGMYVEEADTTVSSILGSTCAGTAAFYDGGAVSFVDADCTFTLSAPSTRVTRGIKGQVDNLALSKRSAVIQMMLVTPIPMYSAWTNATLPSVTVDVHDKDAQTDNTCTVENDPHIKTFDGQYFDNHFIGPFILYKHKTMPLEVTGIFYPCWGGLGDTNNGPTCNCGLSVRNGASYYVVNYCMGNLYKAKNFCGDREPMHVLEKYDGDEVEITLPTGTRIKTSVYQAGFDEDDAPIMRLNYIHIRASASDINATSGLCGFYDHDPSNDFMDKDGNYVPKQNNWYYGLHNEFSEKWRVNNEDSFTFDMEPLPDTLDITGGPNQPQYTTCKKIDSVTVNKDQTSSGPLALCPSGELKSTFSLEECPSTINGVALRRRRSTSDTVNLSVKSLQDLRTMNDPPPENLFAWKNGWTNESATQHCNDSISQDTVVVMCLDKIANFSSEKYITDCVADIYLLGNDTFITNTLTNLKSSCIMKAESSVEARNASNPSAPLSQIQDASCINDCSGHGSCSGGLCTCTGTYKGADCSLDTSIPPRLSKKAATSCNTRKGACNKFVISGSNFVEGDAVCRLKAISYYSSGESEISNVTETVNATVVSKYNAICEAPPSRRRRATSSSDIIANGYVIAVSNDNGVTFSDDINFVSYDATCYICNTTAVTCTKLAACIETASEEKKGVSMAVIIGAAVGGVLFAVVVLVIIVLVVKSKKNKLKSRRSSRVEDNPGFYGVKEPSMTSK